jgi:chemotaxis regulatin CheY-phosphate phosphatase CheZ
MEVLTMQTLTPENANQTLSTLIEEMLTTYRNTQSFTPDQMEDILEIADFTDNETGAAINKFHYINTVIAENAGVPVLKDIYEYINE